MKELKLKFKGIDSWNRPVFVDENGRYFGDTDHLFDYGASKEEVLDFYNDITLNGCISYFGQQFDCEPSGEMVNPETTIILV